MPFTGEVTVTVGAAGFSATSLTVISTVIVSSMMTSVIVSVSCSFLCSSLPSQTCTTTV